MKEGLLILALFLGLPAVALTYPKDLKISDFLEVQIQFNQPLSFNLGKYAEDSKPQASKGEVQYNVNYDMVVKEKETIDSPFCTFSIAKTIKHENRDYAQASNEIIEILQQKKTITLETKEVLIVKEAALAHPVIQFKIESKKEGRIFAECITPGAKEDEEPGVLLKNVLNTLLNSQAKLTKKGKNFPQPEVLPLKNPNNKRKKS